MTDENQPKTLLATTPSAPRRRTMEELTPLARRIAENADLMRRFSAVLGAEDKPRAEAMIFEVTKYAQSLDPTISDLDGTGLVFVLMQMVGHPKGRSNG